MRYVFNNEVSNYLEIHLHKLREEIRRIWLAKLSTIHIGYDNKYCGETVEIDIILNNIIYEHLDKSELKVTIISEDDSESQSINIKDKVSLLIDPIDGTHNLLMGYPAYTTSIAVYKNDRYIMGWVYDIPRDIIYKASLGEGSYMQSIYTSKRIYTSPSFQLNDLRVSFHRAKNNQYTEVQNKIINEANKVRISSCSSLDICLIASGVLHAFLDLSLMGHERCVDIAAAKLILEESGGYIMTRDGNSYNILSPTDSLFFEKKAIIAVSSKSAGDTILELMRIQK